MSEIYIIDAIRTPRGAAKETGSLHSVTPTALLAGVLSALQQRIGLDTEAVGDAVFGCVTQTGEQGGNIGKSASLLAGWNPHMSAVTINRFCASGLSAVNFAGQQAWDSDMLAVGGGVEMMSRVPMFGDQPAYVGDKELASAVGFVPPPWSSDLVATRHGFTHADCDAHQSTFVLRTAVRACLGAARTAGHRCHAGELPARRNGATRVALWRRRITRRLRRRHCNRIRTPGLTFIFATNPPPRNTHA